MSQRIPQATWEQVKTAYAAGIGLREIARNMNISEGTVLSWAKREGWTRQIQSAMQAAKTVQSTAVTPMQSVAASLEQRGKRHLHRMAGVSERAVDHIETMHGGEILASSDQIDKLDKIARRTYGLNETSGNAGPLSLNVLCGNAAVIVAPPEASV